MVRSGGIFILFYKKYQSWPPTLAHCVSELDIFGRRLLQHAKKDHHPIICTLTLWHMRVILSQGRLHCCWSLHISASCTAPTLSCHWQSAHVASEPNQTLTQVIMEKKEKAMAARAASAPWLRGNSSGVVRDHWLARKQKLTKYRKVQKPAKISGEDEECDAGEDCYRCSLLPWDFRLTLI